VKRILMREEIISVRIKGKKKKRKEGEELR
jgi:hypothetical protein